MKQQELSTDQKFVYAEVYALCNISHWCTFNEFLKNHAFILERLSHNPPKFEDALFKRSLLSDDEVDEESFQMNEELAEEID